MDTISQLTKLIRDKFEIDLSALPADLPLSESGLDSLSLAELVFAIEENFDVRFPDQGGKINTLAGLVALIDELRLQRTV